MQRTALVTGGNRGIGFEICRQLAARGLRVVLTARDPRAAASAAAELGVLGGQLDVSDADSVRRCAECLREQRVQIDVLVNNAGIYLTRGLLVADERELLTSLETNLLGAWRTCRTWVPGMRERGWGRVVNVSTGYAHLAEAAPQAGAYGLSKAGLNALTRMVAAEAGPQVKVNAVSPGWVATRMGGAGAPLSAAEGADTAVWLATLADDGPSDGFFYRRERIAW